MAKNDPVRGSVPDQLLTVHQVASRLRVSTRQVWKLAASDQMPRPLKLSRSARWRESDIARFIAGGCSMAGASREGAPEP
jgi:predicted DNA-binding transcriptional regulator AlpA